MPKQSVNCLALIGGLRLTVPMGFDYSLSQGDADHIGLRVVAVQRYTTHVINAGNNRMKFYLSSSTAPHTGQSQN